MIHTLLTVQANENYPCNRGSSIRSNTCNSSNSRDSIQLTPSTEENDSFIGDIQSDGEHHNRFENVTVRKPKNAENIVSAKSTLLSEYSNLSLNGQLHEVRNNCHQKYEKL